MNAAYPTQSKNMGHNILLEPQNVSFSTSEAQTILEAAQQHNVSLQKGCVAGVCRVCKLKLISGDIDYLVGSTVCLTEREVSDNYFLPCCAIARSDIICSAGTAYGATSQQHPKEGVVVIYKERRGSVFIVRLKLSRHSRMAASPGQYIDVEAGENIFRSYSIANVPQRDGFIELHIRYRQGGVFSERLKDVIKLNDVLWIKGPQGDFILDESSGRDLLFMATGTGLAPIQAMLTCGLIKSDKRIHLYWGARCPQDLYFLEVIRDLESRYEHFCFTPVWSRAVADDRWKSGMGYVQDCAKNTIGCLKDFDVYACGSPAMIQEAFREFTTTCELPVAQFHSDAFYCHT